MRCEEGKHFSLFAHGLFVWEKKSASDFHYSTLFHTKLLPQIFTKANYAKSSPVFNNFEILLFTTKHFISHRRWRRVAYSPRRSSAKRYKHSRTTWRQNCFRTRQRGTLTFKNRVCHFALIQKNVADVSSNCCISTLTAIYWVKIALLCGPAHIFSSLKFEPGVEQLAQVKTAPRLSARPLPEYFLQKFNARYKQTIKQKRHDSHGKSAG